MYKDNLRTNRRTTQKIRTLVFSSFFSVQLWILHGNFVFPFPNCEPLGIITVFFYIIAFIHSAELLTLNPQRITHHVKHSFTVDFNYFHVKEISKLELHFTWHLLYHKRLYNINRMLLRFPSFIKAFLLIEGLEL